VSMYKFPHTTVVIVVLSHMRFTYIYDEYVIIDM